VHKQRELTKFWRDTTKEGTAILICGNQKYVIQGMYSNGKDTRTKTILLEQEKEL